MFVYSTLSWFVGSVWLFSILDYCGFVRFVLLLLIFISKVKFQINKNFVCLSPTAWRATLSVRRRSLSLTRPSAISLHSIAIATVRSPAPVTPTAPPPSAGPWEPPTHTHRYGPPGKSSVWNSCDEMKQDVSSAMCHMVV